MKELGMGGGIIFQVEGHKCT